MKSVVTGMLLGLLWMGSLSVSKATTFTVINTNDAGAGSLRQAIIDANADLTATAGSPHLIEFDILPHGHHTIVLESQLSMTGLVNHVIITGENQQPGQKNITVDGGDVSTNFLRLGENKHCEVRFFNLVGFSGTVINDISGTNSLVEDCNFGLTGNGESKSNYSCLGIHSSNSLIRRCVMVNSSQGVFIGDGHTGIVIENCFIGTDETGTLGLGNSAEGIACFSPSEIKNNVICCGNRGVTLHMGAEGATVENNFIGTNPSGAPGLGSTLYGVSVHVPNVVLRGNTICSSNIYGILVGVNSQNTVVEDNFIGTNSLGESGLGNRVCGIQVEAGEGHTISGNIVAGNNLVGAGVGIGINVTAGHCEINQNTIGGNINGNELGNTVGVKVRGPGRAQISGYEPSLASGNIIANNSQYGIDIEGSDKNAMHNPLYYNNGSCMADHIHLNYSSSDPGNTGRPAPILTHVSESSGVYTLHGTTVSGAVLLYRITDIATNRVEFMDIAFGLNWSYEVPTGNVWEYTAIAQGDGNESEFFVPGTFADLFTDNEVLCPWEVANLSAIPGNLPTGSYTWYKDGQLLPGQGEGAGPSIQVDEGGDYHVDINGLGCSGSGSASSLPITIDDRICGPPPCEQCIQSFVPHSGKKYYVQAWVREDIPGFIENFERAGIKIDFHLEDLSVNTTASPVMRASGPIIEGWQRIEAVFVAPEQTHGVDVTLLSSTEVDIYYDDIRIHPYDGLMQSYVYDPETYRLMAVLDENNYGALYEYDEQGELVRIKKETERGIMTIQESRNNIVKVPNQ